MSAFGALFLILGAYAPAPAEAGCRTKSCEVRVAKKRAVEAAGVPWCHRTWRCVKRARQRHPRFRPVQYLRPNAHLRSIAQCESGGNPRAVSENGIYRGKYQFDYATWASIGGRGDPAAASEREQDHRAMLLYRIRGAQPWPVCRYR